MYGPHLKHNVYIVVVLLKTKNIFIDRILTCSVQYIKSESKNLYSFMLLRYQFSTENVFFCKKYEKCTKKCMLYVWSIKCKYILRYRDFTVSCFFEDRHSTCCITSQHIISITVLCFLYQFKSSLAPLLSATFKSQPHIRAPGVISLTPGLQDQIECTEKSF